MKKIFSDHLGREITLNYPPRRIISLCPSITETLIALDLPGMLVGRTRYCVHPLEVVRAIPSVGGTKQVDYNLINDLQPDLIIVEKEENPKEMVEILEKDYPVYAANVENVENAISLIEDLARLCGNEVQGITMAQEIDRLWREDIKKVKPSTVAYFIWRKPYMVVGNHTYIHSVLQTLGFENVFAGDGGRYPTIDADEVLGKNPEYIFLSSEPFPFSGFHLDEFKELSPGSTPVLVDGEMFSWYGVRMMKALPYFNQLMENLTRGE